MQQPVVPAWKKLGLKLKHSQESSEPPIKMNGNGVGSLEHAQESLLEQPRKKRKFSPIREESTKSESTNGAIQSSFKSPKPQNKKLKKKVSFSLDAPPDLVTSTSSPSQKIADVEKSPATKQKKEKRPRKDSSRARQASAPRINPALEYLSQYHTSRPTWKFNKTREIWILKHALSEEDVPRDYDVALARYLHGLKGIGARERLENTCLETLRARSDDEGISSQTTADRDFQKRFRDMLQASEDGSFDDQNEHLRQWIQQRPRPQLLLDSLGSDARAEGEKPKPKKRKNRTVVVEYDSSSSSSSSDSDNESESESDSENESDSGKEADRVEDSTSSSGSDSSDESTSSSDSE
ncbi:uncharacterized protein PV06_04451 [Exophiala oligosperma]|uniref:WKF domain-containing protein n=1 Tax=Exophiala oligosperma TaxID=215243 RepID=A0A0D2E6A2_9EURO|nr:uncharacterized protein PV06_04451 [Exophiala oligosperma]KIW43339.1 hypothetical protein PV06_04451 [Exophiala oligosperma]